MKFRMHNLRFKIGMAVFLALYIAYFTLYIPTVSAFDAMSTYPVADTNAASGDLLSNTAQGLVRASKPYDSRLFGVVVDEPLAVYRNVTPDKTDRPVATNSDQVVNVTDINGAVSPGDPITSSLIPGKGMKATAGGFIIGMAISTVAAGQPVSFQGKTYQSGQVRVSLRVGFYDSTQSSNSGSIFNNVAASFFKNAQDPSQLAILMRFTITGVISVLAFVVGLYAFTRSIGKGIEAIGRNPLAKRAIQTSIIIQVVLTLVVTFGAIVLSFLILRA